MQLLNQKRKFDGKKVEEYLRAENKFITEVLSWTSIPERNEPTGIDEGERSHINNVTINGRKTSRAKSLEELQQRLQAITNKKKLSYKEKLTKKGIKNRMKKKNLQDEQKTKKKMHKASQLLLKSDTNIIKKETKRENGEETSNQPVFNKEDKMVFSKIDFADLGKIKKVRKTKDPKKILQKIQQEREKIEQLKESGHLEKAAKIKDNNFWKNALARAMGEKVKDDPTLLKKSLKKREQKQKASAKKWNQRIKGVEQAKEERQKKRQENLQKRKKDKKTNKLKKAAKKGKIIPGF